MSKEEKKTPHISHEEAEANPTYDRGIVPAEVGARIDREQENFKQIPEHEEGNLDTTSGYTMDREGLLNNYAVEPEMYVNVPGDLKEEEEADDARRAQTLHEVKEVEGGLGKGQGVI
ncbi:conserved hypothetical protein [Planktothrix serta PCC 8927]|uniref:Uncharacterized protein n=1 Tax=Planktothrix serta PCC 8927 TaxID=671068 RepID=A0A7Z9BVM9_9CYAN|nr:hypothetical protein [Planktothrix serta]VXD23135.1 conserved hypothetical protein [Planktothrix serta PCC 8927]